MANLEDEAAANGFGYITSSTGRLFKIGEVNSVLDKLKIVEKYDFLVLSNDGTPPSIRKLAEESKYSRTFVKKVLDELRDHGHVIDPKDAREKKDQLPGERTLDNQDETRPVGSSRTRSSSQFGELQIQSTRCYWHDCFEDSAVRVVQASVPLQGFLTKNFDYPSGQIQTR